MPQGEERKWEWGKLSEVTGPRPSILTVSRYQHPTSLGFSTLPHPFPLAAPANILISLLLQLMKSTVLADATLMSTDVSQVGVALFPSF